MNNEATRTVYRMIAFGPIWNQGRTVKYEMELPTLEQARGEVSGFLSEERAGLCDIRVETYVDGRLMNGSLLGSFRWDVKRACAVKGAR
jgi:hypothetical protein